MTLSRWIQVSALSTCVLILAACSSTGTKMAVNGQAGGANGAAAQTFALQDPSQYKTDSSGLRVNPLTAPANQSYYFSFDENTMRPQDLNALNIQAQYLVTHPNATVQLNGNTDDRGSREYNVGLGWRRDQSIVRFLLQQGVKQDQINMVSFGKEKPAMLGENEHAWSLNRRVDLMYKAY